MPYHYRPRRRPPLTARPVLRAMEPAISPQPQWPQLLLPGVDPLVAELTRRCCPLWQPDVLLYGPTLKNSNLAELARRCFRVHYIQATGMLWGAQCLGAQPFLLPHQYERLENSTGNYRLLPLRAEAVNAAICVMSAPFENRGDLLVTLCELKRVLRSRQLYGASKPCVLLRGVIPALPLRGGKNGSVPFTAAQEYWEDVWPMAAEAGFTRVAPTTDATGLDLHVDPPTFTWRLAPA